MNLEGLNNDVRENIYALPIQVKFMLNEEDKFNEKILSYVQKNSRNSILAKERMQTSPKTAIILGTGLGQLASEITDSYEFSYQDIPNSLFLL